MTTLRGYDYSYMIGNEGTCPRPRKCRVVLKIQRGGKSVPNDNSKNVLVATMTQEG